MKVEFYKHNIEQDDIDRAVDVLRSIFLTTGAVVDEFESAFSLYMGLPHTVGLTSCTAALHLSLLAWGIGEGDEVITTPMSFCATANAVLHAGARPVFVDVEESTGNIDAGLIEQAITERTRAIIPVHLYGQMCDMKKIREIADRRGLVVIEDAAHSVESERDGIRPGQLAEASCFSFYATKNLTSGEGGAVCIHDAGKADTLKMLRLHGIDRSAADRYTKRYRHWDMRVPGWKYNMDNIQAALLIGQLGRLNDNWERRNMVWELYDGLTGKVDGLSRLERLHSSRHAMHLYTILADADRRDAILHGMQDGGVGVAVNYRPIHLLDYYRKTFGHKEGDFPVAEGIGSRTISLPFYPKLADEEVKYVVDVLKKIMKEQ